MNKDEERAQLKALLDDIGILDYVPEEHMKDTPRRLLKYLHYWLAPPREFSMTTFANDNPKVDSLITIPNISFWSCCSHHLLPFFGHVSFGYLPDEKLIGLSKVAQLVRWLARAPQVQEHLATEIADFLEAELSPLGLVVHIRAWHTCQLMSVGPDAPQMVTTVVRGRLLNPSAKAEFLQEVYKC